ncbi:Hypothetical predicted protein, partial [Pelobates cultripes]
IYLYICKDLTLIGSQQAEFKAPFEILHQPRGLKAEIPKAVKQCTSGDNNQYFQERGT